MNVHPHSLGAPVRISRDDVRLIATTLVCLAMAFVYFLLVALPVLRGNSDVAAVVGDSFLYHESGKGDDFPMNLGETDYLYSVGLLSMFGMSGLGQAAAALSETYYEHVIFCFNAMIFFLTLRNWKLIFAHYGSARYDQFLLLFLVNPVWLVSLVSLNKEIWSIFAISSFIKNVLYGSRFRFLIVVVICSAIRDVLGIIGLAFLVMNSLKARKALYLILIGISVLLPFVSREQMNTAADLGQRSAELMQMLTDIEGYLLGYVVTYVPKLLISLFGAMAPHRFEELSLNDPYGMAITLSSVSFFICSLALCWKVVGLRQSPKEILVAMFFAYTIVGCLVPYSVHRLFVPIYAVFPAAIFLSYPQGWRASAHYARVSRQDSVLKRCEEKE